MTYRPDTILKRKNPQDDPYDEVRVIGQALVSNSAPKNADWDGGLSDCWSVTPTTFGSPQDKPLGELYEDYEVVSEPSLSQPEVQAEKERLIPGPSPEDAFKKSAKAAGAKQSRTRVATPLAPQTDEAPTTATSVR